MPRTIANAINSVARQSIGKDWLLYSALLDHWQEIVGNDYAQVTTPVKMTFPHQPLEARRQGGTLCVRLPKGLAMEFSFKAEQIKQRVNDFFGYAAISKITFDPSHIHTHPKTRHIQPISQENKDFIEESVRDVSDGELKDALQNLGKTLLTLPHR